MTIKSRILTVPHYPKEGVMFRDITTLLKDPVGFRIAIHELANRYTGMQIDKVAGIESRGFILGAPLAYLLGLGFVPIRKKGKLPAETVGHDYELEAARSSNAASPSTCPISAAAPASKSSVTRCFRCATFPAIDGGRLAWQKR